MGERKVPGLQERASAVAEGCIIGNLGACSLPYKAETEQRAYFGADFGVSVEPGMAERRVYHRAIKRSAESFFTYSFRGKKYYTKLISYFYSLGVQNYDEMDDSYDTMRKLRGVAPIPNNQTVAIRIQDIKTLDGITSPNHLMT